MGTTASSANPKTSRVSVASDHGGKNSLIKGPPLREHKRFGVVVVKYQSASGATRRGPDGTVSQVVTPRGVILYGSLYNPTSIQKAINMAGFPMLVPAEMSIPDARAHRLLVSYCQGWHLVPFPEVFSRHSGTCYVVGDRNNIGTPFQIKVGDCFRLGSVGLVVSEMKLPDQEEQKLDAKTLQFLKDEALAFDIQEEWAELASDELDQMQKQQQQQNSTEKFFCYMCYETHNTLTDPLIAPCECKGDTRFLHVQCLQKWYHSSALGTHAQVIRTTGNGAPACKICGSAYKTNFRRRDGRKASILEMENNGPYISLVVVTHHDTNPGLFNTKFRLNFGYTATAANSTNAEHLEGMNTIMIGRSSSCAMVLDYRTVSTTHAKISYSNGKFHLTDERSSNGTLVYLQDPLPLPFGQTVKVRMGRTTISLQAKRSWSSALRSYFFGATPGHSSSPSSPVDDHASVHEDHAHGHHSTERPSMSPHHFQQLQLHQQHIQQLRQSTGVSLSNDVADYSFLTSLSASTVPSPCDVQAFLSGIVATIADPNKPDAVLASLNNNNPNAASTGNLNSTANANANAAARPSNGPLVADAPSPIPDNRSLDSDPEAAAAAPSSTPATASVAVAAPAPISSPGRTHNAPAAAPTTSPNAPTERRSQLPAATSSGTNSRAALQPISQPSDRTFLEHQDSHLSRDVLSMTYNADDLSTVDNSVIAPLRSAQTSFVLRQQLSNVSALTSATSPAVMNHTATAAACAAADEQDYSSGSGADGPLSGRSSGKQLGTSSTVVSHTMMVSNARGVDDGSGIVVFANLHKDDPYCISPSKPLVPGTGKTAAVAADFTPVSEAPAIISQSSGPAVVCSSGSSSKPTGGSLSQRRATPVHDDYPEEGTMTTAPPAAPR
eukprot:gene10468-7441_t